MSRLLFKSVSAAALSVGVFGSLFYWGYSISTLDPSKIPVIRKAEGLARIAPEDAGGETAQHQGLAVNEVQSLGSAGETAMRVVLAPAPELLTDEDLPAMQLVRSDASQSSIATNTSYSGTEPKHVTAPAKSPTAQTEQTVDAIVTAAIDPATATKAVPEPVVITGLRPRLRPTKLKIPKAAAPKPQVVAEPKLMETVPTGTKLVQLGAYDNFDVAKSEWKKLIAKHSDLLGGKTQLVQKATSGGRQFYRLRAVGFKNADASRSLCSALIARGTACIPVTAR